MLFLHLNSNVARSLPDVTEEEMAFILKSDKSAWTEADEDAAHADPPFFSVIV